MGYRVSYDGGAVTKVAVRSPKWRGWILAVAILLVLVMMAVPAGRTLLRDLLLPGDEEVTAEALEGLVTDLKDGEPVGKAVEVFCKEIIYGG